MVVTLDDARPRATALAVRDGRIVRRGRRGGRASPSSARGTRTHRPRRRARCVPGLTDAHVHVEGLGAALERLDLVGAASPRRGARARGGGRADARPPGEWLLGRGWDQNDWPEKRFPTAADLDRVAGDRPVYLVRVDGHAGLGQLRGARRAGRHHRRPRRTPRAAASCATPPGRPPACWWTRPRTWSPRRIPAPAARGAQAAAGARACKACAEAGLTSVHDAGVRPRQRSHLYKELLAEGALPIRVYVMLRGPDEFLAGGACLKPEIGLGDGRLTVRAIKVVADGALGSRGALLLAALRRRAGHARAAPPSSRDASGRCCDRALAQGFQVNTHAIGDARQPLGARRLRRRPSAASGGAPPPLPHRARAGPGARGRAALQGPGRDPVHAAHALHERHVLGRRTGWARSARRARTSGRRS